MFNDAVQQIEKRLQEIKILHTKRGFNYEAFQKNNRLIKNEISDIKLVNWQRDTLISSLRTKHAFFSSMTKEIKTLKQIFIILSRFLPDEYKDSAHKDIQKGFSEGYHTIKQYDPYIEEAELKMKELEHILSDKEFPNLAHLNKVYNQFHTAQDYLVGLDKLESDLISKGMHVVTAQNQPVVRKRSKPSVRLVAVGVSICMLLGASFATAGDYQSNTSSSGSGYTQQMQQVEGDFKTVDELKDTIKDWKYLGAKQKDKLTTVKGYETEMLGYKQNNKVIIVFTYNNKIYGYQYKNKLTGLMFSCYDKENNGIFEQKIFDKNAKFYVDANRYN